MYLQFVTLLTVLLTASSVSGEFRQTFVHHFKRGFPGNAFFGNSQSFPTLPQYVIQIFHGQHFPFYRPGMSHGFYQDNGYPIDYLPDYLRRNKGFDFRRYTSYLEKVFGHQKNSNSIGYFPRAT